MNRTLQLICISVIVTLLSSCRPDSSVTTPIWYADEFVSFSYPSSWRISSDDQTDYGRMIFVEGPRSLIVILTVYTGESDPDLATYADMYLQQMPGSLPFGKVVDARVVPAVGVTEKEEALDFHADVVLLGVKVPHTANLWKQSRGEVKVIGVSQVSDEDRAVVEDGFHLIRRTLFEPTKAAQPGATDNLDGA